MAGTLQAEFLVGARRMVQSGGNVSKGVIVDIHPDAPNPGVGGVTRDAEVPVAGPPFSARLKPNTAPGEGRPVEVWILWEPA